MYPTMANPIGQPKNGSNGHTTATLGAVRVASGLNIATFEVGLANGVASGLNVTSFNPH